jgi:hypothetical protein
MSPDPVVTYQPHKLVYPKQQKRVSKPLSMFHGHRGGSVRFNQDALYTPTRLDGKGQKDRKVLLRKWRTC